MPDSLGYSLTSGGLQPDCASVSVALCTHNGAAFISEQIRSILAQTVLPREVVVSDDASQDDTLILLRRAWQRFAPTNGAPSLRVLANKTPLGVTDNFAQAVSACVSEFVALSDQDDRWDPRKLETLVAEFAENERLGLLFTDARLVDSTGAAMPGSLFEALQISESELSAVTSGDAFAVLLRRNLATGATVMFRRALLGSALPFPSSWVHDEWLAVIASVVSSVGYLPDRLTDYRQHGANQIGVTAPTVAYKIRRVLEPRGSRPAWLVERARQLLTRLHAIEAGEMYIRDVSAKLTHDEFRAGLPRMRLLRIPSVAREALAGRYQRFSSQRNLDTVRDIMQPDSRGSGSES